MRVVMKQSSSQSDGKPWNMDNGLQKADFKKFRKLVDGFSWENNQKEGESWQLLKETLLHTQ